mgnify:CR=1
MQIITAVGQTTAAAVAGPRCRSTLDLLIASEFQPHTQGRQSQRTNPNTLNPNTLNPSTLNLSTLDLSTLDLSTHNLSTLDLSTASAKSLNPL